MNLTALSQIEEKISQLPHHEQLWLLERIIHRMRKPESLILESELQAMALDQEIQQELKNIEDDFRDMECDGFSKNCSRN